MKRFGMLVFLCLPCLAAAQSCSQGQTMAFSLAAGVKAAWNPSVGVIHQDATAFLSQKQCELTSNQGGASITWSANSAGFGLALSIYSIAGSRLKRFELAGVRGMVTPHLANGYYLVRLERGVAPLVSSSLVVER